MLLCIIATLGAFVVALRSARVQTAAVAIVTDELSRAWQVDMHIDRVDIRPPLALCLQGVYMSDQQGDTLLSVPELQLRFNPFALEDSLLSFPLVQFSEPYIRIVQDSSSTNIDFLLRAFEQPSSDTLTYGVECRRIALRGARMRYIHRPSDSDVLVSDICTDVGFRYLGKDSIATALRAIHFRATAAPIDGYVEADIHGSLDTLYADQLRLVYRGQQLFHGDIRVSQPLSRDSLFAHVSCTDLQTNAALLTALMGDITHRPVSLPEQLHQVGDIHYRGVLEGHPDNLHLNGAFLTHLGTITTDALISHLDTLQGTIKTSNWALGRMLHSSDMGRMAASVQFKTILSDIRHATTVNGRISRLDYRDYTYSGVHLVAQTVEDGYKANLRVDDDNLQLALDGLLHFEEHIPYIDAHLSVPHIYLAQLNLTDSAMNHQLSLQGDIHLKSDTSLATLADDLVGVITFDSVSVSTTDRQLYMPQVSVVLSHDDDGRHLALTSPVLNAGVDGNFTWTDLPVSVRRLLHNSLPSLVALPTPLRHPCDLDFYVHFLRVNDMLGIIMSNQLSFPVQPSITGYIHDSDEQYAFDLSAPLIHHRNDAYRDGSFSVHNDYDGHLRARASVLQQPISLDSTMLRVGDIQIVLSVLAQRDTITTAFEFGSPARMDSVPDLYLQTSFTSVDNAPYVDIHILPSDFVLGDKQWKVEEGHITYSGADTLLEVTNFKVHTEDQHLVANGRLTPYLNDSLLVEFRDMDLGYLLSATQMVSVVDFQGRMTGWATLYSLFSTPQFEANITMPHGYINGTHIGCLTTTVELDRQTGEMIIDGNAVLDSVRIADITGRVVPSDPVYWEVFLDAHGLPMGFINFWTKDIIEDIDGKAFGRVHFFGRGLDTWVTTRAYGENAVFTVPATGGRYFFSDSIILDTTSISFPVIHLRDAEGHAGVLTGIITHNMFMDMRYRLDIDCSDVLVLDLPADPQSIYYGRIYASGHVTISGDELQTHIDVAATTAENTDFYLSTATASDASSTDFITFRQPADESLLQPITVTETHPASHLWLNLAVEVLSSARIHLVLDPKNGDGIVGRGEGNLRLNMDAYTTDVQLSGNYTLLNGTFSYTVGNLVHRDFSIQDGSTLTWSGDPTNPELDIIAKYRCTASLRDLFGADLKSITSRSSIPVDCVVRIVGPLNNMTMKFGIEFPQSDESVAAQINSVINTEAMLMRQVIYLLIFNRFYQPDYMRATNPSSSVNDAYSLLSSTVTGQINSWLSKLTSTVNVGINMRADGEVGNQSYETEANIQIQPIDRFTINGNVGYRYNDISNQPIFGDVDVEYELTADGKLRAKVFTHSVDKYSLHQSGMQEGVGFIFRHDFNSGDAKRRRELRKK